MSSQTNVYPSNTPSLFYFFLFVFFLFLPFNAYPAEQWQHLSTGIEYRDLEGGLFNPWSHVHVFRIDLTQNQMELVSAESIAMKNASADQFVEHSQGLIGINGGFFDKQFRPLGLRINHKKIKNPVKPISWWGIFYIKNNKAHLSSMSQFRSHQDIDFAIQSGPRLIINGKIPSLKPGIADRTALGITQEGKVILLVSNSASMSTKQLAQLMKSPPLSCVNAINLDGGSSSQLYAHIHSFKLNVHGFSNVSDAIVIKKREKML